jgi:cathepsin X
MMQEIYQRGPIACGVAVPDAMENYTSGVFHDKTGDKNIVHDISVVGYGVDNGVKYWTVRNSWGTHYGEDGFIRVVRGINNIAIETDCAWATVKDTWTTDKRHKLSLIEKFEARTVPTKQPMSTLLDYFMKPLDKPTCRTPKMSFKNGEKPPPVHSWEGLDVSALPKNWDWGNMNGVNYLSWNKNQHIPQYCGSCWSQGTTSSIADRFNIKMKAMNPTPIALNAQVIVNCRAGGSCQGGNPGEVYEYANMEGIPDSSCEQYVAANGDGKCTALERCKDCTWPPCPEGQTCQDKCWPVKHKNYYVQHYYNIRGADRMKAELYKNGPISCGVQANDQFEAYMDIKNQEIYKNNESGPFMMNHEIAVVGWGTNEKGEGYWIGRNSWGTYWGDSGFFYMTMDSKYDLGITNDCSAGIPGEVKIMDPYKQP